MQTDTTYKLVPVIYPAAIVDNASPTSVVVDTLGWNSIRYIVFLGATDIAMTALKLQEADAIDDANTLTSGADITGLIFGTSVNTAGSTSTLPSSGDDNKFFVFELPLKGRKRYLDLTATCGDGAAGTYITAWAELRSPSVAPITASGKGASQILALPV